MNTIAHSQREVEAAHSLLSQATVLFDESLALTYALVMALAHTPRNELSQEEIDGLCQLEQISLGSNREGSQYLIKERGCRH
jgi:hypothetical protein